MLGVDQRDPFSLNLGVTLPSGESASDLVAGKPGAFPRLLAHYLGRSAIIGLGLLVAGARGRDLVIYSLAGSAATEVFVLLYAVLEGKSSPACSACTS